MQGFSVKFLNSDFDLLFLVLKSLGIIYSVQAKTLSEKETVVWILSSTGEGLKQAILTLNHLTLKTNRDIFKLEAMSMILPSLSWTNASVHI